MARPKPIRKPPSIPKPITDWCKHEALFFDRHGAYVGRKTVKYDDLTFSYRDGTYNFKPERSTFFRLSYFFHRTKYYLYTVGLPDPIRLNDPPAYLLNAKEYKAVLDTDLITKLNEAHKTGLMAFLSNPKVIFFLILIGIAVWYFSSGGFS